MQDVLTIIDLMNEFECSYCCDILKVRTFSPLLSRRFCHHHPGNNIFYSPPHSYVATSKSFPSSPSNGNPSLSSSRLISPTSSYPQLDQAIDQLVPCYVNFSPSHHCFLGPHHRGSNRPRSIRLQKSLQPSCTFDTNFTNCSLDPSHPSLPFLSP